MCVLDVVKGKYLCWFGVQYVGFDQINDVLEWNVCEWVFWCVIDECVVEEIQVLFVGQMLQWIKLFDWCMFIEKFGYVDVFVVMGQLQ